jgi:hypothetical protein
MADAHWVMMGWRRRMQLTRGTLASGQCGERGKSANAARTKCSCSLTRRGLDVSIKVLACCIECKTSSKIRSVHASCTFEIVH